MRLSLLSMATQEEEVYNQVTIVSTVLTHLLGRIFAECIPFQEEEEEETEVNKTRELLSKTISKKLSKVLSAALYLSICTTD